MRRHKPLPPYLRPSPMSVDTSDPRGMGALILRFLEWMKIQNYSEHTIRNKRVNLKWLAEWCDERSITKASEVTKPILDRYKRYLFYYRQKNGKPLSFKAQQSRLISVRVFFSWLTKNNLILYNPASELELPKVTRRLPKHVLTSTEAEEVLSQPDVRTSLGIRDRAILETFYSTGARRAELLNLRIFDLDTERGTLMIREGKGKKDRMVPIGERAIAWIEKYLSEVRPMTVAEPDNGTLFLTRIGDPLTPIRLTQLVRNYIDAADIGKTGSCHLFRHTMATVMLENGADIRYIQQILGHAELSTTQIYTHISIRKLKQIHTATHPAKLNRDQPQTIDSPIQTSTSSLQFKKISSNKPTIETTHKDSENETT